MIPGTYAVLQRGRKPCGGCEAIIGAGRRSCPACGYSFGSTKARKTAAKRHLARKRARDSTSREVIPTRVSNRPTRTEVVVVPAGRCPVALAGTDRETVLDWARKATAAHERSVPRYALSTQALGWWAREFFPRGSAEHRQVLLVLAGANG